MTDENKSNLTPEELKKASGGLRLGDDIKPVDPTAPNVQDAGKLDAAQMGGITGGTGATAHKPAGDSPLDPDTNRDQGSFSPKRG